MIAERAPDASDEKLSRLTVKRVGVALRGQRDKGTVKSSQGTGLYMTWELV